jgi:hypothetical protein
VILNPDYRRRVLEDRPSSSDEDENVQAQAKKEATNKQPDK